MRLVLCFVAAGCAGDNPAPAADGPPGGGADGAASADAGPGAPDGAPDALAGPMVDRTDPMLHEFSFSADEADPAATEKLGTQLAALDTRVEPAGLLVVYLHGAGAPSTCGSGAMGTELAGMGFHVFQPCYVSDYGVGNCGSDIGGCRLEAFEGVDHHSFVDVTPPNSIEQRVVMGLRHLDGLHPGGDWGWFVDGDRLRWSAIVISGISHGGSSSGLIGQVRAVDRVVMLSGPLDTGQAWLSASSMTPIDRFYGFSHTGDTQHPGHLEAWATMGLPGAAASIDGATPPYGGTHRLITSATSSDPHSSVQAGGSSPMSSGAYVFAPAWHVLYGR